ncbi:MAG: hypothetical protein HY243_18065 [Proteobacteria bacterium]|nr:hypothetical protein [Pseudomonadota bacterium]
MKFRLTYEGRLDGNGSPKHKHEIRKAFHPQLKRLWDVEPNLKEWGYPDKNSGPDLHRYSTGGGVAAWEGIATEYERLGYRFVPLGTEVLSLIAAVEVLFLRDGTPGSIVRSGDIDNRLKTLFDALKMPGYREELGGYNVPAADENPFFVLLEDDKLLSHVSVETDMLLQPTPTAKGEFLTNDCRLIITVSLRPSKVTLGNLHYA